MRGRLIGLLVLLLVAVLSTWWLSAPRALSAFFWFYLGWQVHRAEVLFIERVRARARA